MVTIPPGGGAVTKHGDPQALRREATGLRRASGRGLAPELLATEPGSLAMSPVAGRPRRLVRLDSRMARSLGERLRLLHDVGRTASGALPGWGARARGLVGYRRRRVADVRAASTRSDRSLVELVTARAGSVGPDADDPRPFRFLHGDLVESNILWHSGTPWFVDFEFWRMGDPAEDLAYLWVLNDLPDRVMMAVFDGYGDAGMRDRAEHWRALCALDAGLWYRRHGRQADGEHLLEVARVLASPARGRIR